MLRILRIALAIGASTLIAPLASVAADRTQAASSVLLEAGTGRVLELPNAAANVFVADSKVAEVRPASASALFVYGVAPGRTTVAAMDSDGALVSQFDVTVHASNFGAAQAQAEIARLVPNSHVSVRALPTTLMLSGSVETPADATRAVAVAQAFAAEKQTVENQLTVHSSVQVTLRVRIVEMSRSLSRQLGVNWSAVGNIGQIGVVKAVAGSLNGGVFSNGQTTFPANGGANVGIGAVLDALSTEGMVRTLAEPNLTVISGQPASFLVGGQFPVPVPGGATGQVTVSYKNYGVSLSFLPTVFSDGRISIHVAPEVSQLSSANAVSVASSGSTVVVPSLTVRRAETTVELGSGQTFAIGGLLQDSVTANRSALPYLSDLPILGPAFRDDQFQRGETEIVILVTPYTVRPVSDQSALQVPNEAPPTSDLDRLLYMRTSGSNQRTLAQTPGVAGFIVQ
ncbi:MAG TPA: type II and III secretion system protein family protein [Rhodopila sp.]|nr:type II and III secretion system protein family protein [Rhodopila sp.]